METLDKLKEIISKLSLKADDYNMNLAYNNVLFIISQIQKEEDEKKSNNLRLIKENNGTEQGIDS